MANYYGAGRSNYIHVTNVERVRVIAGLYELIVIDNPDGTVAFIANADDGDFNTITFSDRAPHEIIMEVCNVTAEELAEFDDLEMLEFTTVIQKYMIDGEVFIWQHSGAEGNRYVSGYAVAVNNKGEEISLNLNDITQNAKSLWPETIITSPEY